MLSRVVAVALLLGVLAGCRETAESAEEPELSGCPAVQIVGIRGQGQSLEARRGLGAEVAGISDVLTDELASLGTVRTTAVRHTSRLGSWDEYLADVADGRKRLRARVTSVAADCPDTRVVVIGFSQGSQIAREELARPDVARHVDALVLVGSPVRDPSSPFRHVELPGGMPAGKSRLGPGPDLGELADRSVEACMTGDAVCTGGASDEVHRHAYEDPDVAGAIARAAADLLTG